MSHTVSVSREIAASPESVWAVLSDLPRMGEFSPENTGGSWIGGATGPAVGARFKGTNSNGSKSWSTIAEVVECEAGRSFAFDVGVGPIAVARWRYEIEPVAVGCKVTETWSDRRGWLARKLGGVFSGVSDRASHNRAGMEQTLDRIAAAVR